MKQLFFTLTILLWSAVGSAGGVGGFSGGSDTIRTKKGSILFQDHSTFVNPLFSQTLCLDKKDRYNANLTFFGRDEKGDIDTSNSWKKWVTQPRVSMKEKCVKFTQDDRRRCLASQYFPYVQERVRKVEILDDDGRVKESETVRVPDCR